jgi:hypothetical protein
MWVIFKRLGFMCFFMDSRITLGLFVPSEMLRCLVSYSILLFMRSVVDCVDIRDGFFSFSH